MKLSSDKFKELLGVKEIVESILTNVANMLEKPDLTREDLFKLIDEGTVYAQSTHEGFEVNVLADSCGGGELLTPEQFIAKYGFDRFNQVVSSFSKPKGISKEKALAMLENGDASIGIKDGIPFIRYKESSTADVFDQLDELLGEGSDIRAVMETSFIEKLIGMMVTEHYTGQPEHFIPTMLSNTKKVIENPALKAELESVIKKIQEYVK